MRKVFQGLLATLLMVLDTCMPQIYRLSVLYASFGKLEIYSLDMSQVTIKNPSKSNPLGLSMAAKSSIENI